MLCYCFIAWKLLSVSYAGLIIYNGGLNIVAMNYCQLIQCFIVTLAHLVTCFNVRKGHSFWYCIFLSENGIFYCFNIGAR